MKNDIDYTQAINTLFKSLKSAIIQLNEDSNRRNVISKLSYLDTVISEGMITGYVTTLNKFEVTEDNKESRERARSYIKQTIGKFDDLGYSEANENAIRFLFAKNYIEQNLKEAFSNKYKVTLKEDASFKKTDKKIGVILEVTDALTAINLKSSIDLDTIQDLSAFSGINILDVQVNGFKNAIESFFKRQTDSMLSKSDDGSLDDIKGLAQIIKTFELMSTI